MPAAHHRGRAQAAGPVSPLSDPQKDFSSTPTGWKSNKWPLKATDLDGYGSASTTSGSRNTNGSGSNGSGAGSATGSGPKDNWSRDERDESSSSDDPQVADVKKGPEESEARDGTNFPSLQRDGPTSSLGSKDHPDCKPCAFYCYSLRGCRNGHNCSYCHLFHESKLRQRRDEWKKEQREKRGRMRRDVKDGSETQSADGTCLNVSFNALASSAQLSPAGGAAVQVQVPFQVPVDQGRLVPRVAYASEYQRGAPPWPGNTDWKPNRPAQVSVNNSVASTVAAIADVVAMTQDLVQRMPDRASQFADPDPKLEFYSHNPSSSVVTVGQQLEIWPPAGVFESGMVFAVSPDLPQGVVLDQYSGMIHGIPKHPTRGLTSFFVTACKPGVHVKNVKTSMVNINVVNVQAPGYTVASLYQPEPGLTVVALREDLGQTHFAQQQHQAWEPSPGWTQPPSALSYDTSPNEAAGAMMRMALEARQRAALWGRDCPPSL